MDGLVQLTIETGARMLEEESIGEGWDFRLQFPGQDQLSAFRTRCEARDIPIILRRIYDPHYPTDGNSMTSQQHEAVLTAYERGYFDVPRNTSVSELAGLFEISDSAYSQRLRRGLAALVYETMMKG